MHELTHNDKCRLNGLAYCFIAEKFTIKHVNDSCIIKNNYLLEKEKDPKLKIVYNIMRNDSYDFAKKINILKKHFDIVMLVLLTHTSKKWLIDSMSMLDDDENIDSGMYLRLSDAYESLYKLLDNFE